jgi:hypothetical protein
MVREKVLEFMIKLRRQSLGARTSAGRLICSITLAMVYVLPDPVITVPGAAHGHKPANQRFNGFSLIASRLVLTDQLEIHNRPDLPIWIPVPQR